MIGAACALIALSLPTPAAASVEIGPERVVVTDDGGARAVVERRPFRIRFETRRGQVALEQVPNPAPGVQGNVDHEGVLDLIPETAHYAPLAFQVGVRRDTQHPGGLWTGNMLVGAEAGIVHAATEVVEVQPWRGGAFLRLATTDPLRTLNVRITPDRGSAIRLRAQPTLRTGVVAMADSFTSGPREEFHGFGGRHVSIDHRGWDFYNWIEEEAFGAGPFKPVIDNAPGTGGEKYLFPNGPHQAYYVQNIFYSSRPYGFMLADTEVSRWRMAADSPEAWQVNVRGQNIDYTVAIGPQRRNVKTLTAINGRHRVAPDWAMGPTLKRNVQQGADGPPEQMEKIREDLRMIKKHRDQLQLTGYSYESWDTLPREFVLETNRKLKRMGIHPIGYVRAYVNDEGNFDRAGTFADALSRGIVAMTPGGLPWISVAVGPAALYDPTNPDWRAWWWKNKIKPQLEMGFDGFMQDFGEQTLEDMRFHDGSAGIEMHNLYPTLFHKATRELVDRWQRKHPGRGKVWMYTRAGFSGRPGSAAYESSNFPGDETTDWQPSIGLPSLAPDMLNRAVGGSFGFTTDIGGYFDNVTADVLDDELFSRWMQWSALTPHFRLHNSCCTNGTRMPWHFETGLDQWQRYAGLHHRATPYIKRLWRQGRQSGMPPTRPMWLAYPRDKEARAVEQQWMLGPHVLVAPVVEKGARTKRVYFPGGCWRHGDSGKRFRGRGYREVPAPVKSLPWFERCGTDPIS